MCAGKHQCVACRLKGVIARIHAHTPARAHTHTGHTHTVHTQSTWHTVHTHTHTHTHTHMHTQSHDPVTSVCRNKIQLNMYVGPSDSVFVYVRTYRVQTVYSSTNQAAAPATSRQAPFLAVVYYGLNILLANTKGFLIAGSCALIDQHGSVMVLWGLGD